MNLDIDHPRSWIDRDAPKRADFPLQRLEGDKTIGLWVVTPEATLAMDATAEIA